ncbi:MAG: S41 family peptidase [Pseudomonadota bacterium]
MRVLVVLLLSVSLAHAELPDPKLSAEQAAEDIRLLELAMTQTHPGYGRYTPVTEMQDAVETLRWRAAQGIGVNELIVESSRVLSLLRCDHTKAEIPSALAEYRDAQPTYLPLQGRLLDGRFYAWHSGLDGLSRGDEILSINGRPMADIVAAILPLIAFDGYTEHAREVSFGVTSELKGGALDHFLPLLYGPSDQFTITVARSDGETRQLIGPALTYGDWLALDPASKGRYRNFSDDDAVRLTFPDAGTAVLAVDTFVNYRTPVDPDDVYRDLMRQLDGRDTLILDLRQNGGGSEDASVGLLRYLMDKPFRVYREKRVRSIDHGELRPYYSTWEKRALDPNPLGFKSLDNGEYRLRSLFSGQETRRLKPARQAFKGRLVVMTARNNASGSTALLTVLKQRDNTVFVGETTGGNPDGTTAGVLFFLKLPNSGITVRIPWFRQVQDTDTVYGGQGLEPDEAVRVTIEDLVADRDPILARALELAIDP